IPAEGRDIYRCFVIPVKIPPGKYLRAVEYRPQNRRVVHHAVFSTMDHLLALARQAMEPKSRGPGFFSALVAPGQRLPGAPGIWAPGKDPLPLPDGYAMRWPWASDLILQLHFHPSGKAEIEQSSIGLYLTDQAPKSAIRPIVLMNKNVNIPPGEKNYHLDRSIKLSSDVDVIGIFPHMHLLGQTMRLTAAFPDGT